MHINLAYFNEKLAKTIKMKKKKKGIDKENLD